MVKEETYQEDVGEFGAGHGFDHAKRIPANGVDDPVIPADFELHDVKLNVEQLTPETEYRCRVIAENADGEATGPEGKFKSLPPLEIGSTWSSGIGFEGATLNAEINPLGIQTTAYFEYVDEATYQKDITELGPGHGFDRAIQAPGSDESLELGAGESFVAAAVAISGLSPGTGYRYRVIATDQLLEGKEVLGPAKTLRTYQVGEGGLPDGRAYEMVSPPLKNGAEVGIPGAAGGLSNGSERQILRAQAAAGSGQAVTYTSWTSFGEAESAPIASQYLSRRIGSGWQTENVTPYGFLRNALHAPYRGFDPELETGGFVVDEPALTPEAQEGFSNVYLRNNATGTVQALTVEEPEFVPEPSVQGLGSFCTAYAGASKDGKRAFFAANGAMAGATSGKGFSLYEWSETEGLKLASMLPNGTPATPAVDTGFGAGKGRCQMSKSILAHAISEDGKRAFWSYGGKVGVVQKPLLVRVNGERTIQLDAKPTTGAGLGPFGQGVFWAATPDGSYAFFSAPGKLTSTAKAEGQIYRYDVGKGEAEEGVALESITPGTVAPELQGVVGASADGKYLYFVAQGTLTGEQQGPSGQKAQEGANNLYLWHEGDGVRFIGRLSELDESAWSSAPETLTARVAPDGRHLAFFSVESQALVGYDNTIAEGSGCQANPGENRETLEGDSRCLQAFLYDAEASALTCASCNPTGSRPTGPSTIPPWSNPLEGPRYLSEDGSKFFFETFDALIGADENDLRDVYEFEVEGSGSCEEESPTFNPASGGCIFLISDGKSDRAAFFIDASSDGSDVFFTTRSRLVGWDEDTNYDVYDAREGGGFPEPPPPAPICEGEGCKPAPLAPPLSLSSPGTASFQGSGNQVQKAKKRKAKKRQRAKKRGRHRNAGKKRSSRGHAHHKPHRRR